MRRLLPLLTLVVALGFTAVAGASPQQRTINLGLFGDPGRFAAVTHQNTTVRHVFLSFHQGKALPNVLTQIGSRIPMVAVITGTYGNAGTATPKAIARGKKDTFLFQLNTAVAAYSGSLFYLRPFPEMNGHWSASCAYNENGTRRPAHNSTAWFKKAFARVAIISRGGTAAEIDAKLAKLHLPGIHRDLPVNTPKLQIVWNPQGFGSPDVPGNSANAYYPGNGYVDVVADDLYDMPGHGATWAAAQKLYDSHPAKAFGFGEWGLWGIDDPSFIRTMGSFARTHKRLVLLAYFNSKPGSTWDMKSKPKSAAAYRKYISPLG
ncbi:MAG TPA: hypothetical protein VGH79_04245 [Gaiellaceae bacterium]|jgi:hypothetical protein